MSFADYEESDYAGQPQELYRFAMGDSLWLYTSADQPVFFGEDEYLPCYIKRSGFTKTGDANKASIEIEMAASNDVALMFRTGWLYAIMTITVYRHHFNDVDYLMMWKGRVTACKWSGSVATLTSENAATIFKRAALRRCYQIGCPHALFEEACGVNANTYAVSATVSAVAEQTVTLTGISGFADGYFVGGRLKFENDYRMITAHFGGEITLVDSIFGMSEGSSVTIWPGCARTLNACKTKFNSLDNFGGLPFLPKKNPFSGDALV